MPLKTNRLEKNQDHDVSNCKNK